LSRALFFKRKNIKFIISWGNDGNHTRNTKPTTYFLKYKYITKSRHNKNQFSGDKLGVNGQIRKSQKIN
jgi:hypothetical protein